MLSMSDAFSVRVNGEFISALSIDRRVSNNIHARGLGDNIDATELGFIRMKEAEEMIESLLLVQHTRSRGFSVEEAVLHREVLKRREADTDSNGSDLGDLDDFVESVHNDMLINLLLDDLKRGLHSLDDVYLEEYYEANKGYFSCGEAVYVRHILFEYSEDVAGDSRMRDRALSLLKRIKGGEDFVYLAKEFSHCPSAGRGGDLGYVYRGSLGDSGFEDALFLLNEGEVSELIESSFGYHIVEILGKVQDFVPPFISIKGKVRDFVIDRVSCERVENLIEELWSKASIEYLAV